MQIPGTYPVLSVEGSEHRFAVDVRQLFRAMAADDAEAVNRAYRHLRRFLVCFVAQRLDEHPRWTPRSDFLDSLEHATMYVVQDRWLRINSEVFVYRTPKDDSSLAVNTHYACERYEPFMFEAE